jgi:hypothetical protein
LPRRTDVPYLGVGSREIRVLAAVRSEGTPLLEGYDDGTFRPTARVIRAQVAAFLTRSLDVLVRRGAVARPR